MAARDSSEYLGNPPGVRIVHNRNGFEFRGFREVDHRTRQ